MRTRSLGSPAVFSRSILCVVLLALPACGSVQSEQQPHRIGFTNLRIPFTATSSPNISSLSEVIRRNPDDSNAYNMRGTAYGEAGNFKRALTDFNAALAINPRYFQAYSNRALVNAKLSRVEAAFSDYNQSLLIAPNYHIAYLGRGTLHTRLRNYPLALADYSQAIDADREDPIAYYQRGLIYQMLRQHRRAIRDFNTAIALKPNSEVPYFQRGQSLIALNDYQGAYDDFEYVTRERKADYHAWTQRGLAAERLGRSGKAERAYRRALAIQQDHKPALDGLQRVASGSA